jgi:hypothetical protein
MDWYGASISFVKRFGNQKVKENTKTDAEKAEVEENSFVFLTKRIMIYHDPFLFIIENLYFI